MPISVQRIEAPDGLIAWRITAWRLNIEWGKMQDNTKGHRPSEPAASEGSVG